MVEIGIHPQQPSPHLTLKSRVVKIPAPGPYYMFHTKIECVQTESAISYQLDPSNLS